MNLFVEGPDGSGKSTLARMLSTKMKIPYIHPVRAENGSDIPLWAKSQWETLTQLHKVTKFNCIFNRSYASEWVYNYFMKRNSDISYLNDIDEYFSSQDCFYCYLRPDEHTILHRMISKKEEFVPIKLESAECLLKFYDKFYEWTKLPKFMIDTSRMSEEECVEKILKFISK
jgi:thymidylate kinase